MLASEKRCIYCASAATTIEHMPPIALFRKRSRPQGLEFGACKDCNEGTRVADLVASFYARLGQEHDEAMLEEAMERRTGIQVRAPGLLKELFENGERKVVWAQRAGIHRQFVKLNPNGPLTKGYLCVFAAKFAMALYREHVGEALPLDGGVHVNVFLNAGLADKTGRAMLEKMPIFGTLQQGRFTVPEQFAYRFNTDKKSILAALSSFHSNLHLFVIAVGDPVTFSFPKEAPYGDYIRPGELIAKLPAGCA